MTLTATTATKHAARSGTVLRTCPTSTITVAMAPGPDSKRQAQRDEPHVFLRLRLDGSPRCVARVSLRLARIISKPDDEQQDAARDLERRQGDAEEVKMKLPGDAEDA